VEDLWLLQGSCGSPDSAPVQAPPHALTTTWLIGRAAGTGRGLHPPYCRGVADLYLQDLWTGPRLPLCACWWWSVVVAWRN